MSSTDERQPLGKITVQAWRPIFERFDASIERACLRRDAWLARVLDREIDMLDREVPYPNAEAARKLVSERLARLDRKLVSIKLPLATIARLDALCLRSRIVRDAFFNRLFLLLASGKWVDPLFGFDDDWWRPSWEDPGNDLGSLDALLYPLGAAINPLALRRDAFERRSDGAEFLDVVDTASGVHYRVIANESAKSGFVLPPTLYNWYLDMKLSGNRDLVGLNTFISHEQLEELTAPDTSDFSDLEAQLALPEERS